MGSSATLYLQEPNFGPKIAKKKALTIGMLICKLPLIVIVAHESCIVNKQIWVREFKYGVIGDPLKSSERQGRCRRSSQQCVGVKHTL